MPAQIRLLHHIFGIHHAAQHSVGCGKLLGMLAVEWWLNSHFNRLAPECAAEFFGQTAVVMCRFHNATPGEKKEGMELGCPQDCPGQIALFNCSFGRQFRPVVAEWDAVDAYN